MSDIDPRPLIAAAIRRWRETSRDADPVDAPFGDFRGLPRDEPDRALPGGLVAGFASPAFRTPCATELTPAEIAAQIARGVDPYANAVDEASRPLAPGLDNRFAILARLAFCLAKAGMRDALAEPGNIVLIEVEAGETEEMMKRAVTLVGELIFPALARSDPRLADLGPDHVARLEARHWSMPERAQHALEIGQSCVLLGQAEHLPPDAEMFVRVRRPLPSLCADMVIAVLRASHSPTGELAEQAIRDRLPGDADLARLPPLACAVAFHASSTLKVADRLAEFAVRLQACDPDATANAASAGDRLTLDTVVGLPDATRAPLEAAIADLRDWRAGAVSWSEVPANFLLHGPPGTGKTRLASAVAGDLDIPIIATSYADWQSEGAGHLGTLLKAMRETFDQAGEEAPCVLFLDEMDSFPVRRGIEDRGDRYDAKVVNGLLAQMNRLARMEGVLFIGASNHPDLIDPALLRAGRLDLQIPVPAPDRAGLAALLRHYLGTAHIPDSRLAALANQLLGRTGADVEGVVKRARTMARLAREALSADHLQRAADLLVCPEDETVLARVAVHEAGHALVARGLGCPVGRMRISMQGGVTPTQHPGLMTLATARDRLAVMMAGHAAERIVFGAPSSGSGGGAASDLAGATRLATRIHAQWGLGEDLLHLPDAAIASIGDLSRPLRRRVEAELREAMARAEEILRRDRAALDHLSWRLLEEREVAFGAGEGATIADGDPSTSFRNEDAEALEDRAPRP